ncbi:helix-turn-helix transcriptional regulator [Desulfovibrio sp. OttesenSCG-928-G11]|nr:helix-turn-helix transcriptional regulator [Desulfovibrio sp. OttesenSCG-928-G11]
MSKIKTFLAGEIKSRRKRAGLSQEKFSELTGISKAQISEMERGIANPSLGSLEKIAEVLQVSVAELLDMDEVLSNPDRLKESIWESMENLPPDELRRVLALIRLAQK